MSEKRVLAANVITLFTVKNSLFEKLVSIPGFICLEETKAVKVATAFPIQGHKRFIIKGINLGLMLNQRYIIIVQTCISSCFFDFLSI